MYKTNHYIGSLHYQHFLKDENINKRKAPEATSVTVLDSPAVGWGNAWLSIVGAPGIGIVGIGKVVGGGLWGQPQNWPSSAVTSEISTTLHFSN